MVKRKRKVQTVTSIPEGKRWLDTREAAFYLGMSPVTLYRRRKYPKPGARRVPTVEEGGRVMFDRRELDAYMEAHATSGKA